MRWQLVCVCYLMSMHWLWDLCMFNMPARNKFHTNMQVEVSKLNDEVRRLQNMVRAPFKSSH